MKPACEACRKVLYADREAAELASINIQTEWGGDRMNVYECPYNRGSFHLTSQRR